MTAVVLTFFTLAAVAFACSLLNHARAAFATRIDEFVRRRATAIGLFLAGVLFMVIDAVLLIGYVVVRAL